VERLVDGSALFAVSGHRDAAWLTYAGLHAQQHRAGLATSGGVGAVAIVVGDADGNRVRRGYGLVQEALDHAALSTLGGVSAIGRIWGSGSPAPNVFDARDALDADGVAVGRYRGGSVAAAVSGRFVNAPRLRRELKETGVLFQTPSDAELLLHLLAASPQQTFVNRLVDALWKIEGSYSLLVSSGDRVVAVRDPAGFRPLVLGRLGDATLVASEETGLRLVDGELRREMRPGEMVILDRRGTQSVTPFAARPHTPCVQEVVQVARGEARVGGRSVHEARLALGEVLGERFPCEEGEVVTGIGAEGDALAAGYARATGLPSVQAIVREPYSARRFAEPPSGIRDFGTRLYWRAVPGAVQERSVVLVVPALVTGIGLGRAVHLLVEAGAREVHVRVATPMLRASCAYGVVTPSTDELLSALHDTGLDPNGPGAREPIGHWLGVRSLQTLPIEAVRGAVAEDGAGVCDACLTGNRPLPLPTAVEDQLELF
jgi:amidophosphoribosyltransferase